MCRHLMYVKSLYTVISVVVGLQYTYICISRCYGFLVVSPSNLTPKEICLKTSAAVWFNKMYST